jgi:hypothetical protein
MPRISSISGQEEIPDATRLALVIARSGAASLSLYDLRMVIRLSPRQSKTCRWHQWRLVRL